MPNVSSSPKLITAILLMLCGPVLADYTAAPVSNVSDIPHCYTGRVRISWFSGYRLASGVVVSSDRTVVTAGHTFFDIDSMQWAGGGDWSIRGNTPFVKIRGIRYNTAYGDLLETYGNTSREKFSEDFAVLVSYESLTDVGHATAADNPSGLVQGSSNKLLTGFPSGLYPSGDPDRYKMHQTGPFTTSFELLHENYYGVRDVAMGPGSSGGGIWVNQAGSWKLSGIIVAGQAISLGKPRNATSVVLLNSGQKALIEEAISLSNVWGPPVVDHSPDTVWGNWDEATEIRVDITSVPSLSQSHWYYRDARDPTAEFEMIYFDRHPELEKDNDTYFATLTIPSESTFWNNKVFQVLLRNPEGSVTSDDILFKYPNPVSLKVTTQPTDLVLTNNADAVFDSSVTGFPTPIYTWEVLVPGTSEYAPVDHFRMEYNYERVYVDCPSAHTQQMTLPAYLGFFHDSQFRLKADNGYEAVTSNAATLSYSDLGVYDITLTSTPPELIQEGQPFEIRFEYTGTGQLIGSWDILDGFGRMQQADPDRWERADQSLLIKNAGEPIHGYSVNLLIWGKSIYWDGGQFRIKEPDMKTYEWTLSAVGPPQIGEKLNFEFDKDSNLLTLVADAVSLEPPRFEWQYSLDSGNRWFSLGTTDENHMTLPSLDLIDSGALFRTKVTSEGQPPALTDACGARHVGTDLYKVPGAQVMSPMPHIYRVAVHGDNRMAIYGRPEQYGNDRALRIFENNGNVWHQTESIEEYFNDHRFIDENTLLVANSLASVDTAVRAGNVSVLKRNGSGEWDIVQTITAAEPLDEENFGNFIHHHDGKLFVASPYKSQFYARIHYYELENDQFVWKQELDLSENRYLNIDHVVSKGNLLIVSEGSLNAYFRLNNEGGWEYVNRQRSGLHPFITSDNSFIGFWPVSSWDPGSIRHCEISQEGDYTILSEQTNALVLSPMDFSREGPEHKVSGVHSDDNLILYRYFPHSDEVSTKLFKMDYGEVRQIDFSEDLFAAVVFDRHSHSERVVLIPLDEVIPTGIPKQWKRIDASLEDSEFVLTYRESTVPDIPTELQSSSNGSSWQPVQESKFQRKVLDPDIDGDGKTRLIEVRIDSRTQGQDVLYRVAEQ